MCRAEEMQADDVAGPVGRGSNLVDVERRRICCEHGARFNRSVQRGEHVFLDRHALDDRLDDEIRIREVIVGLRGRKPRQPIIPGGLADLAARHAAIVKAMDRLLTFREALFGIVEQRDLHARRQAAIGDTRAHRPGAEHRDLAQLANRRRLVDTRHFRGTSLGEECMTQTGRLRRRHTLHEEFPLGRTARVEVGLGRNFDGADNLLGRHQAACARRNALARRGKHLGIRLGHCHVANAARPFRNAGLRERHRGFGEIALRDLVDGT